MQPNIEKLGRIYTTVSLAVLPVALVVMFTYLYTFNEQGSQSQGLPALMLIFAVILGVLGINTLAATILSVLVANVRPKSKPYLYTLLATTVLAGLFYLATILT
jgi:pheromone shutdown protein TraB